MHELVEYAWPGNVRELENVIERAMILALGTTLTLPEPLKTVLRMPQPPQTHRPPGNGSCADSSRFLKPVDGKSKDQATPPSV